MSTVRVWDLPTRIFHWSLVLLVIGAYVSAELDELEWHERCGLSILALLSARIIWGFVGSETSRFRHFVKGPGAAFAYLGALLRGRAPRVVGHNPAGGLFVLLLMVLLLVQISFGLFANDEIYFEGPLAPLVSREMSDTLTDWHHWNFAILAGAVGIHIAVNFLYLLVLKRNLIWPMVTGNAEDLVEPERRLRWRHSGWSVLVLALTLLGVGLTIGYR